MEGLQSYRMGTFLCDITDMKRNTISTLFPIRKKSPFAPLDPNGIRLIRLIRIFFSLLPEWGRGTVARRSTATSAGLDRSNCNMIALAVRWWIWHAPWVCKLIGA
jgi:hypothetical protein